MTGKLKSRPMREEKVTENGVRVGTLVTIKEPWLVYSVQGKGGRWLNVWRPALDFHSPRPGEPAIVKEIIEGGRFGNQYYICSLLDSSKTDWFEDGDFEVTGDAGRNEV